MRIKSDLQKAKYTDHPAFGLITANAGNRAYFLSAVSRWAHSGFASGFPAPHKNYSDGLLAIRRSRLSPCDPDPTLRARA